ncbi:MAG: nucleotidyl transferase AbiEii/AbiGii toxin family protein [Deltaproteobacteria bacterium]|nr:MAG: nucleotidyl transferase AbiEii/AbiGii toxin family protein [Deltaproteobacteria bacterium]
MTNTGKSIRTRLLNIAKKENLSFQLVIIRYLHERLLYRVSLSLYANNFCLKGGVLLYVYCREQTRPTLDIDFLGTNIPNEIDSLKSAFREICSIYYPPDAVVFDKGSIVAEEIAGQDEYPGIRLFVTANLDTICQRIQVDIGFGDIVIPAPVQINYPTLLHESKIPIVQAYSLETVVAEKFEAMIDLSVFNSRMKDFYDIYQILITQHLNPKNLEKAIRETFRNRNTIFTPDHALFSNTFPTDINRQRQWKAFLVKNHLDQTINFNEVIGKINNSLFPIWKRLQ